MIDPLSLTVASVGIAIQQRTTSREINQYSAGINRLRAHHARTLLCSHYYLVPPDQDSHIQESSYESLNNKLKKLSRKHKKALRKDNTSKAKKIRAKMDDLYKESFD